jgi:hypothetical protein
MEKQIAQIERLILIYNADAGLASAILDSTKKLLRLKACSLCTITHGLLKEKQEWQQCQQEFGVPIDYLHRDEVPAALQTKIRGDLPVIFAGVNHEQILLLTSEQLANCRGSVAKLKEQLLEQVARNNLSLPNNSIN